MFYQHVVPRLPPDVQAIFLDPPSLSKPSSFLPVLRLIAPYVWFILLFIACFIVWSVLTSFFAYFSRFLRFTFRAAPIIALIAWIMASSGQGSMDELFELVKQWAGLSPNAEGRAASPGVAAMANLLGLNQAAGERRAGAGGAQRRSSSRQRSYSGASWEKQDPVSGRTRSKRGSTGASDAPAPDFVSSLINSAIGGGAAGKADANNGPWAAAVQDYVKTSVLKATGMDWLFGAPPEKEDKKKSSWTWTR
ncbi:hypothetical protein IAT38_006258 [Cryptococcus sp. DSM 104549]